jgi:hypothetical protein
VEETFAEEAEFEDDKENMGGGQSENAPQNNSAWDAAAVDARALQELSLGDGGERGEAEEIEEDGADGEEVVPPQRVFEDVPEMDSIQVLCDDTQEIHSPDPTAARSLHYNSDQVASSATVDPHAEGLRRSLLSALIPSLEQVTI